MGSQQYFKNLNKELSRIPEKYLSIGTNDYKLGQIVYLLFYYKKLIIPSKIVRISYHLNYVDENCIDDKNIKIVYYLYIDKDNNITEKALYFSDERDEDGYRIPKPFSVEIARSLKDDPTHKTFPHIDIDEPIGYSVDMGVNCFDTLGEAMQFAHPTKKKHLKRQFKVYRKLYFDVIIGQRTRKINKPSRPEIREWYKKLKSDYPDKKIYVRKK